MRLFRRPMSLMVSLARNDPDLAKAAIAGGADAVKVHIGVEHRASGTKFGSLREERAALRGIIALDVPVGLVVGGAGTVRRDDVRAAVQMGVAFCDVYLQHAPVWYPQATGDALAVVALGHDDPLERAAELRGGGVGAVEASLAPPEEYGSPLTLAHLTDVARLARICGLPVIVPTQHAIEPADVSAVSSAGAAALLIGAVVTGDTADSVQERTASYRAAVDELEEL